MLIIPLLQTLLFNPNGMWEIISSAGITLVFAVTVIIYSVTKYRNEGYALYKHSLYIKKGLFLKTNKKIIIENIDAVTLQENVITAFLFDVCRLFADVPSVRGDKRTSVYIPVSRARKLLDRIIGKHTTDWRYKAKNLRVLLVAALWSNSATGFLILAPLMNNISKLMGERFAEEIYDTIDISSYLAYVGLPPLVAVLANFLLICWGVAMVAQLNRYISFTAKRCDRYLIINRGFLNRVTFAADVSNVNSFSIRQSIFMMPVHLYSTYIYTISAQKTKGDKSLLLAGENRNKTETGVRHLLGYKKLKYDMSVGTSSATLPAYLYFPMATLVLDALLLVFLYNEGSYHRLLFLILFFTAPVLILWFLFRIIAHKRASFGLSGDTVKIVNYTRLTVSENFIPLAKVQFISVRQSIFQRIAGTCTVIVYVFSERRSHYTVKHLPYSQTNTIATHINSL